MKLSSTLPLPDEARNMFSLWQVDHDWHRLLVLADWLEENGMDDLAYCFRWMASREIRPYNRLRYHYSDRPSRAVPATFGWAWYRRDWAKNDPAVNGVCFANLPVLVFNAVSRTRATSVWRFYQTEEAAIFDLCHALKTGRAVFGLEVKS